MSRRDSLIFVLALGLLYVVTTAQKALPLVINRCALRESRIETDHFDPRVEVYSGRGYEFWIWRPHRNQMRLLATTGVDLPSLGSAI